MCSPVVVLLQQRLFGRWLDRLYASSGFVVARSRFVEVAVRELKATWSAGGKSHHFRIIERTELGTEKHAPYRTRFVPVI